MTKRKSTLKRSKRGAGVPQEPSPQPGLEPAVVPAKAVPNNPSSVAQMGQYVPEGVWKAAGRFQRMR
jgi:hypothetical protein